MNKEYTMNHQNIFNEWTNYVNSKMKGQVLAVDLNFKKFIYLKDGEMERKEILTKDNARQNVVHFLNVLNKKVYGNASKRFNKKVFVVPVIEGGTQNKQLHLHMTVVVPERFERDDFITLISDTWTKTNFGNSVMKIQDVYNLNGRHNYMFKRKTKDEDIQSAVVVECLNLPK